MLRMNRGIYYISNEIMLPFQCVQRPLKREQQPVMKITNDSLCWGRLNMRPLLLFLLLGPKE